MSGFSPQLSQREYPNESEIVSPLTPSEITREDYVMLPAEQGTYQALRLMASCVRGECGPDFSGYQDGFNTRAANQIVSSLGAKTQDALIAALFQFVRDHIRYVDHPAFMQVVQDCKRTLQLKSGDCVSKSVCLATLLACLGIESKFVAQHPSAQQAFNHVYVEIDGGAGGGAITLDSIADGKDGRPFFNVGDRQKLPDSEDSFELSWSIF